MIFFANTLTADERTIWTELRSRFIRASAVHTIGLHAPSFIPRPKPCNQGNEGQPDVHTQKEHTHARQRRHNTTASPRLRRGAGRCCCCCCAAVVPLLLHDAQCIAEHKPSQQTVSRFAFFGTHAGASNGTAAAAAAVATAAAAAAAQQQRQQQQVQQQGRPKHMY